MEFISQMFFLDKIRVCRICGSDETRIDYNNEPIWIVDKNRNNVRTRKFLCYSCSYINNRYCYLCGREEKLRKHYAGDGLWDGKRICYLCKVKLRK